LCGECASTWWNDNGICKKCRTKELAWRNFGYIGLVFSVVFLVSFTLVAIVQGAYGNSLKSGGIRSLNFAGWICTAMATQAQIARTKAGNQPEVLQRWYGLLKLFEINSEGVQPLECSAGGTEQTIVIVTLTLGVAVPLLFILLAMPFLQKCLVDMGEKAFAAFGKCKKKEKEKKKETVTTNAVCEGSLVPNAGERKGNSGVRFEAKAGVKKARRSAAIVSRAASQRAEIELVLLGRGRRSSVDSAKMGKTMDTRVRLSELFVERRDTVREAWVMDKQWETASPLFSEAEEKDDDASEGEKTVMRKKKEKKTKKKKKKKGACCGKKKSQTPSTPKTPRQQSETVVGNTRKGLLASSILLHPMVISHAIRSVYCTTHPLTGQLVLAAQPGTQCFLGAHTPVFILGVAVIAIEALLLPLFVICALGRSNGWWCAGGTKTKNREPIEDGDAVEDDAALKLEVMENDAALKYGAVHGGLCCRCWCCVERLARSRRSFIANHEKATHRVRNLSYAAFTFNDYKPEFFWVRMIYVFGITVIALCNGVLNPALLLSTPVGLDATQRVALLIGMQSLRYGVCLLVVSLPCVVLLCFLPNKSGSKWKLPLRVTFTLLSIAMLVLNAFSWFVEMNSNPPYLEDINVYLSYIVLAMSMATLLLMAICFIIFVVFRGAKRESAESFFAEQEEEADELGKLARHIVDANKLGRAFLGWRHQLLRHQRAGRSNTLVVAANPLVQRSDVIVLSDKALARKERIAARKVRRDKAKAEAATTRGVAASSAVATAARTERIAARKAKMASVKSPVVAVKVVVCARENEEESSESSY